MTLTRFKNKWMPSFPSLIDQYFSGDLMDWNNSDFAGAESTLPAANLKETDKEYQIEIAVPGLKKKDFNVNYENGQLTISSENKRENEIKEGEKVSRREFRYQSFQRSFTIPEDLIKVDKISARYTDGILRVSLPKEKVKESKPAKQIAIS